MKKLFIILTILLFSSWTAYAFPPVPINSADMETDTYDSDGDGDIDRAAGGFEQDTTSQLIVSNDFNFTTDNTSAGEDYANQVYDTTAGSLKDAITWESGADGTWGPKLGTGATFSGIGVMAPDGVLFEEIDGSSTGSLTAAECSRTVVNSYGRSGAATLTLPTAAKGMAVIFIVGTQHNSAWKIQRAGTDTIYADVGAGLVSGKTYIQETNQAVGASCSCYTFQTGATPDYDWKCGAVNGTWVTD